tara:strand:+ start:116 stop:541 length:426 start_codon:yes stop_codon:yes gene_type:complete
MLKRILNKIMKNDLGVDPNEWFDDKHTAPKPAWENPLDSMPIANGDNKYAPAARRAELEAELAEEPPRAEEKVAEWFVEEPDESDMIEEEKTMHQKMYEMATARNNPFHVGGSENAQSDIDYVKKHSPWPGGSENFQAKRQ